MSIAPYEVGHVNGCLAIAPPAAEPVRPLHRLRQVREQQCLSLRSVARRLNISVHDAQRQESETADLSLSQIYRWQQVLDVPAAELLEDSEMQLSAAVQSRASLVRVMKTAVTLQETARTARGKRLVAMLIDQLVQIMPELKHIGPWQSSGSQRGIDDLGRASEYRLDESLIRY